MNALTNPALAAMYRKELRSVLRWTPLGLLLIGVLCWIVMPTDPFESYQVDSKLMMNVGFGAAIVALAIGLLQSLPELRPEARGFLLHRPISVGSIYRAKFLAGLTAFAICVFPPLVVVAIHLEVIGMERMPASWLQVLPVSVGALMVFLAIYPATLWTVHRDARWIGTRWLPAVFGGAVAFIACGLLLVVSSIVGWIAYAFFLIVTYAIVIHASLHVFRHQTFMPPTSSPESMSVSRGIGLFLASIFLVSAVSVLLFSFSRPIYRFQDYRSYQLSLATDGEVWETEAVWNNNAMGSNVKVVSGRLLTGKSDAATQLRPIPDDWKEAPETVLTANPNHNSWMVKFYYCGPLRSAPPNMTMPKSVFYDRAGRFYIYDSAAVNGAFACVTPRGVFDAWESPAGRFADAWLLRDTTLLHSTAGQEMVVADRDGVYRVRFATRQVEKIIDAPLQSVGYLAASAGNSEADAERPSRIWTAYETDLRRYVVNLSEQSLEAKVAPSGQWTIEPSEQLAGLRLAETEDGVTAIMTTAWPDPLPARFRVFDSRGSLLEEGRVRLHPNSNVVYRDREVMFFPPAFLVGIEIVMNADWGLSTKLFWGVVALHGLFAMGLAVWIGSVRGLSTPKRISWVIAAALGGVGAPLAMAAIHRQPIYEPCPNCARPRRVDLPRCDSCGCEWEPPPSEGNEILPQWPRVVERTDAGSVATNA